MATRPWTAWKAPTRHIITAAKTTQPVHAVRGGSWWTAGGRAGSTAGRDEPRSVMSAPRCGRTGAAARTPPPSRAPGPGASLDQGEEERAALRTTRSPTVQSRRGAVRVPAPEHPVDEPGDRLVGVHPLGPHG